MQVVVTDTVLSTQIVIAAFMVALLLSFRKTGHTALLPVPATQELKGLGMLTIVFAHISYMLVTDNSFLYPLSIAAGVGVDIFLFMSGFGLTTGALRKSLPAIEFYHRRLIKVFIPFWLVIIALFIADPIFADRNYTLSYMARSLAGYFPTAMPGDDVNSPFWYITWMLLFYALFPLCWMRERPWLTAIILAIIANVVAIYNPLDMQANWLHSLHTNAFSLGILFAWWMNKNPDTIKTLEWFRNRSGGIGRYLLLVFGLSGAGYMAMHSQSGDWPMIAGWLKALGLRSWIIIGQGTSLLIMALLLMVFALKRLDNRFLYINGVYSYETYLLHWPLMSRYDIFYQYFPAWAATILWLGAFLIIGWLLQKITTPISAWVDGLGKRS
jgi:peptidoglycan/LPS O-acetylase OafA/YrhL